MPALVIGALTVKATEFSRLPDERSGGGLRRTLNGDLRGRSDWMKRAWAGKVYAADTAELAAVLAVANPDADINVSGDAIGATVSSRVVVSGDISFIRSRDTWFHEIPLSIREV